MIITGYQGIGKTTLSDQSLDVIDLESTSFWKVDEGGNKSRPDDWYIYYCQVAQDLSKQGYIVFVSCHQQVRDYLGMHSSEKFCAIFPSITLKEKWLEKLKNRYLLSNSEKDLRAYEHAKSFYDSDIYRLWCECRYNVKYYHSIIVIDDIDYDLQLLVNKLLK